MANDFDTTELHQLLTQMHRGVQPAREELIRRIMDRVTFLCRSMLKKYQGVRQFEQTDDVAQGTLIRLLRSLEELRPGSMREFFGLVNEQIRRELLDLVKRHKAGKRPPLQQMPEIAGDSEGQQAFDPEGLQEESPSELERWHLFHEAIAQLPDVKREVVGLLFYQGWSQKDAARFLEISDRQVRRHWVAACFKIKKTLKSDLPTL